MPLERVDRLVDALGGRLGEAVRANGDSILELRLRGGRPARMRLLGGRELELEVVDASRLRRILSALMENSLYAWEDELRQGYFTAAGGLRVGVCGKLRPGRDAVGDIASIGSACIRVPREARGCAEELARAIAGDRPSSALILSAPGLGKTTLLRDLVRVLSDDGWNVALADERREVAACREGLPLLDVGARTDVMDACPKAQAIPMLLRACCPDVVAADEIGGEGDMRAIRDAFRAGAAVLATAHAPDLDSALRRESVAPLIREGIFDWIVTLGPEPGRVKSVRRFEGSEYAEHCRELALSDGHPVTNPGSAGPGGELFNGIVRADSARSGRGGRPEVRAPQGNPEIDGEVDAC